jgi:hypothetical protein
VRRAHNPAAPNTPNFGTVSAQHVDGIWYVRVSRIPVAPEDAIEQARLVVYRVVSGVEAPAYKTPIVTLQPDEFVECGPGTVVSDAGTLIVALEAVFNIPGRPVRIRDVTIDGEDPPIETPASVSWTFTTGSNPGELDVTITGITNGSGDNGVPTHVDISLNGGDREPLGDGLLAVETNTITTTPGALTAAVLQISNAFQDFPPSEIKTALAGADDPPVTTKPVWHFPQPQSFTEGDAFSVDFHDYCDGADSFEVVTNLTGGISSGTDDEQLDVASLVPGTTDLTVEATNAQGTSIGIWTITVEPAVLAPSVVRPVADQALVNGDTLRINLDGPNGVFSGTEPMTFTIDPDDDPDFALGAGGNANTFGNANSLVDARSPFTVTLTAENSAGTAEETFQLGVSIVRDDAPAWGTDVTMGASQATHTDWRTGTVSWPSAPGQRLWTRSVPDANGSVPPDQVEQFESLGSNLYRMQMTDPLERGDPDVQTAVVSLGANPVTTTNGSNNIVVAKTAHGMGVGRRVTLADLTAGNGLTAAQMNGSRQIIAVAANTFTVQAGGNATGSGATGGSSGSYAANRADYSVMAPGDPANIRVAYDDAGVISHWSLPMAVPQVVSLGARYWRFNTRRPQEAYEATPPWPAGPGNQYQHVVAWNERSVRDPSKKFYMFTGQDENGVSFSPDGGRTISPIVGLGLTGLSITGLYFCSDDLTNGLLLATTGDWNGLAKTGLYGSIDEGRTWKRIRLNRTNGADAFASNKTIFPRMTMNVIDRRPQNASGTLTDAQRPIYVVAQPKDGSSSLIGCYLFKWDGGDVFDTADWTQVYEWPVAEVRGDNPTVNNAGEVGMRGVRVATNGDVIVDGRQGVWYSSNGGTSFTKKFSNACVRGLAVDMSAAGAPAVAIAVSNKAGANDPVVLKTANISTTGFTSPGNTGLPTNATAVGFNGAKSNFNRQYLVYKTGSSYAARLSTNGGSSWQAINVEEPPGYDDSANAWRYTWGGGRGPTIYPHPSDPNHVFGMVFISGAVSHDGGANFIGRDCSYFDHAHTKGWSYDRNDFRKLFAMLQDSGSWSQNATKWYEELGLKHDKACTNQAGTNGDPFAFATTTAALTASNTAPRRTQGRGACSLHGSAMTLFALSADKPNNKCIPVIRASNGSWVARTDVGISSCARFFHHPTISTTIVLGSWFITGWGTTPASVNFTNYSGREVVGYSLVGGAPRWYFGTSGTSGSSIYRSTNANGSGGTLWKTLASSALHTAVAPDIHNDGTVFVARISQNGKVERHTASTSTVIFDAKVAIDAVFDQYGLPKTTMPDVEVSYLVTDPNMPGLLYVVLHGAGMPVIFMSLNANDANPTFTNETRNLPHTYYWLPSLHPVTGELFMDSSMGEFVLPAPAGYPALTNLNYFTQEMDAFYGRADVPDPPVLPGA